MAHLHEIPAEPAHPPVNPARPVPSADSAHAVPQHLEALDRLAQESPQQADLVDRNAQGLRLAYVVAESGDEIWFAICNRHAWLSIGGDRAAALEARCTGCEAAREAAHRRGTFLRAYGPIVLAAVFAAPGKR